MMNFSLSGGVEVVGFISPTTPLDTYPVIDPLYGIDGLRNVDTLTDLNNIPNLRRRAGMFVGVSNGSQFYKLNASPWNGTITDWTLVNFGNVDIYTTGATYSNATKLATFTRNDNNTYTLDLSSIDVNDTFVTGTTFNSNQAILTRNDGVDVLKLSGGTNVTLNNPSTNQIVVDVTIPPDTNTFVTGFTYDNSNNLTISRNDGVDFSVNVDTMSGLTINGDLLVTGTTNISGLTSINSSLDVYNGTIGLRTNDYFLQGTSTGGTNVQLIGVYSNNEILIGNQGYTNRIMDDTIINGQLSVLSGLTVNGPLSACTGIYTSNIYGCSPITINDIAIFQQGLDVITGNTILQQTSATTITLTNLPNLNNTATEILARNSTTGLVEYRDVSTITPDTNTFVTGFTYDNVNTFTISRNDNVDLTSTISVLSGITYYGDGSNLSGITTTDIFVTGGTFDNNTDTITFTNNSGGTFNVTGITDTFVIAGTYSDSTDTISLLRNDGNFVNITGVTDNFVSGGTYNPSTLDINFVGNSLDTTFDVDLTSLVSSVSGDTFLVSGNANAATSELTFTYNTGGTFTVTNSAALFADNDINVTGGTYNPSNGCVTFATNSGTTFDICGFLTGFTDTYVTGGTYNESTDTITFTNTSGGTFDVTGITDTFVIAGTYDGSTDTISLLRNDGNFVNITGVTDTFTTGATYDNNTALATFNRNDGNSYTLDLSTIDVNDTFSTGGTVTQSSSNNDNNQTIQIVGNNGFNPYNITGLTDTFTTGGTYDNGTALITFDKNDGTSYNVDLSTLDLNDTFITGFTYNDANTFTLNRNDGVDISTSINIITGLTVNGDIEMGNSSTRQIYSTGVSEISSIQYGTSGTSVQMRWDGGGDSTVFSVNNTDFVAMSSTKAAFGGIAYGADYSLNYSDRSLIDLGYFNSNNRYVTGGTYDNGTALISYSGANGFPSFSVDMSSLDLNDTYVTGGTLTQPTDNTNSGLINLLYSQDVSPSTYSIPYTDTFITGFTYNNNNTFTILENNGDTHNVTFNEVSGLTVNGDLNVTGNTYLVDVSGTSLFTDYIDFRNIGASLPTDQQGRIYWDDDNGTLSLGMYGGQVVQQIGLEKYYYIKNQSGATISNGRVVRAAGTLGASGRILGEYMIADGTIPPKFTLGIATEDIINGDDGYVTEFGLVRGINTTGTPYGEVWNDGDILWVSPTIPGGLTKVEPQAPNLKIEIAIVIYANANGSIFVRPNRYPYLYDIQQVNYSAGTENNLDILFWNNSNKTWDKTNTPSFSGLTIYGDTTQIGNFNITGNTLQNGNTTTNGNVDIITTGGTGCTLSVTGKTCLDGDLEVTGNVFVVGNLDYDGNLIVTGSTIISSGLTVFSGVSADFITITTTPTENNDLIQILGRNSSTGDVEYRDVKTIGNNITTVTGTTYSATTTDDVIGIDSSTNTVTLYLPDSVSSGRLRYDIKDIGVNSFNNPITIQAAGSDAIITTSVVSSFELSADGGAIILVNTGTGQWWQM